MFTWGYGVLTHGHICLLFPLLFSLLLASLLSLSSPGSSPTSLHPFARGLCRCPSPLAFSPLICLFSPRLWLLFAPAAASLSSARFSRSCPMHCTQPRRSSVPIGGLGCECVASEGACLEREARVVPAEHYLECPKHPCTSYFCGFDRLRLAVSL